MSEHDTILTRTVPNTVESICLDLARLEIQEGDVVLVHSSLSSLGWTCGGAQTVVDALLQKVGSEGTLVMPSHSGEFSDPAEWANPPVPEEWLQTIYEKMPAYDPERTPSRGMGRIAELFRTYPGTHRSSHPQTSFCANGKQALDVVKDHVLTPQLGMDTPLGKLYQLNAKVLLLGVGYDSCTSFHLAESMLKTMPVKLQGTSILEGNSRIWKWFDDYDYDSSDFSEIGVEFEKTKQVKRGQVGNADCVVFQIRDGVDFAKIQLKRG